jgi:hypothetical protein
MDGESRQTIDTMTRAFPSVRTEAHAATGLSLPARLSPPFDLAALGDLLSGGRGGEDPAEEITDRERVRRLLDEAEGTLRQTEIVDRTDWSTTKVSRLLSEMAADGEITKVRVGRENLICLPDSIPQVAGG